MLVPSCSAAFSMAAFNGKGSLSAKVPVLAVVD